ncbi:MAG TPA: delta-class carbonic anhydrase [Cellvibrionaceae bacterium]|nr:delta-class carbonic anhydrase [Cellvibrionaceae bacterium]
MSTSRIIVSAALVIASSIAVAKEAEHSAHSSVADDVIAKQNLNLVTNTAGKGAGPQSPRDINSTAGTNPIVFSPAPAASNLNLCNIHFHQFAEHKGGEFNTYAGNGDGQGHESGYRYSGQLSKKELAHVKHKICASEHGSLNPGDTIEVHYVHSSAQVMPGATLAACMNEAIKNPQLRVEAQVYVLVNDTHAADFRSLTKVDKLAGYYQAPNIPTDTGTPIQYAGSTTGPNYDEQGSPFEVTWSVRPKIKKVNIATVGEWCKANEFKEDHGHGVRNLVVDPALLSKIVQ